MVPILRSHFFPIPYRSDYSLFVVVGLFLKNSLSEHISGARSPQNLTRSEKYLLLKEPLTVLIFMTMPFRAIMSDGSVDAERRLMAGVNVGCKSTAKSKYRYKY